MDKKKIQQLKRRRKVLEKKMGVLGPLMRGSVVELGGTCGHPNCRCARGEKHMKYYYSMSKKGKTKIIYLGKSREPLARQFSDNYKTLLEIVEEMTTINMELLKAGAIQ
jgi:hypothetical protein|tara:strand:+ start:1183 stop:1509 length:327 start_codon:yes stop_codon:yes gene_type:complete